jgi:histidine triad (HIT) family protein
MEGENMSQHQSDAICRFCQVIRGAVESYVVFEDAVSLAFLDHRPIFPGHCLLIPKTHYETFLDVPAPLLAPLFANVQLLAQAMETGLQAEGSFVAINTRVSQSVPHLHVHVVPRRRQDGLRGFFWPRQRYEDTAAIVTIQTRLRTALATLQAR